MNFGLPNLTKQKTKLRNTTKFHTKMKFRNTIKCHNIFAIFFIPNYVWSQFDILFFTSIAFSQQILCEKLLMAIKLCIKKKKKRQYKKIVRETVNFGSPNLTMYTVGSRFPDWAHKWMGSRPNELNTMNL